MINQKMFSVNVQSILQEKKSFVQPAHCFETKKNGKKLSIGFRLNIGKPWEAG
jgi:hypothetical protein